MSRFKKLELDGDAGGKPAHGGGRGADARNGGFATKIKDADFYMARAEKHELAGDHEKALRFFSSALGENHLLIDAWTGQARMLLELEEYHEARMW
ncbi:MAG: hypothetical protein GY859_37455, partial [Desulfobacterales bacterium]|nr:hypothetical protein [Desulfobacterales bacterium]